MERLPSSSAGLELELELRQMESIPLTQVRDGAESLLSMDVSDDLMPFGLQGGEKPAVPKGADELVAFYEKQLAATQLVQHRLQRQYNQVSEEKMSLETSLQVQAAAVQQQLAVVHEKAERAFAEAACSQQQVHEAKSTIGEIVGSVNWLAELLDASGATQELTRSFEAVALSTQRTCQAIEAADEGAKRVLELQLELRDACLVSPLLLSSSNFTAGRPRAPDSLKDLEEESARLRRELEEAKQREQELDAEMHAAQLLFAGLEAEVVSLQHDQAKATAKLQVSHEELVAARFQLVAAKEALAVVQSPTAEVLAQGLVKLDAHMASIRDFLENLSMPQPPIYPTSGGTLQEQRAAAQRLSSVPSTDRSPSATSIPVLQAVVASQALATDEAVDSVGMQAQVVLLTAERDSARKQVDLLSAKLAMMQCILEESQEDNKRLQQSLLATKEYCEKAAAGLVDTHAQTVILVQLTSICGTFPHDQQTSHRSLCVEGHSQSTSPPEILLPSHIMNHQLSLRDPNPLPDVEQLHMGRSDDANMAAPIVRDPTSTSGTQQQLHELTARFSALDLKARQDKEARLAAEAKARSLNEEKELTALLLHKLGADQAELAEQLRALEATNDSLEAEREQLHVRAAELSADAAEVTGERDLLLRRVADLVSRISSLENEKEALFHEHSRQMGMAAAAGAAGAAAAVAVATDLTASTASQPSSRPPSLHGHASATSATASPAARGYPGLAVPAEGASLVLAALERRAAHLEAELLEVAAEREAALRCSAGLKEEIEVMGELLRRAAEERQVALQRAERALVERVVTGERPIAERDAAQGVLEVATGAAAVSEATAAGGSAAGAALHMERDGVVPVAGSPSLIPKPALSPSYSRRSHSNRASESRVLDGPADQFLESGSAAQDSRTFTASPILVQSSYQSFTSEAPLVPTRRFTDASEFHTYLLDPTEPLEELLHPAGVVGMSSAGSLRRSRGNGMPGATHDGSGNMPGTPRASTSGYTKHDSADEVAQLQATVCSLLVSKAVACARLREEFEGKLLMLQAAHQSELAVLHDDHLAEVAELQASLAAATVLQPLQQAATRAHVQCADRSTRVSESSLPGGQYEAELLQHAATLEVPAAEMQERQQHLVAHHEARYLQLQADHALQVSDLQMQHDADSSKLRAAYEEQLSQLRLVLQQREDDQVAQRQAAAREVSVLQQLNADLQQQAAEHESRLVELRGQHIVDVQEHEQHYLQLQSDHALQLLDLQTQYDTDRSKLQAACEEQLSQLRIELQQSEDDQMAQRQATADEISALQYLIAVLQQQAAQHESRLAELRGQQAADVQEGQQQHEARYLQMQANHALQLSDLQMQYDEGCSRLQGVYEEQLSQLRIELQQSEDGRVAQREATAGEMSALQQLNAELQKQAAEHESQLVELRGQLEREHGNQEARSSELEASHQARLLGQQDGLMLALSALQQTVKELNAELLQRDAVVSGLTERLQQLQSEKELEEQSLQSLSSTKAWMTDEIRSLQADLKDARAKQLGAEAEISALRGAATDGAASRTSHDAVELSSRADTLAVMLADQLAEAAMQAALAEARLEAMEGPHRFGSVSTGNTIADGAPTSLHAPRAGRDAAGESLAQQTGLMMETVALHGELDEVKGRHRVAQAQLDAVTDELVHAVLRASLAESQLEQLRLRQVGGGSSGLATVPSLQAHGGFFCTPADKGPTWAPAIAQSSTRASAKALLESDSRAGARMLQPSGQVPLDANSGVLADKDLPPPEHLGTVVVSPLQQTRHLHAELEAVTRALGELYSEEEIVQSPVSRQVWSSLWPAILTALNITENVASSLAQQQIEVQERQALVARPSSGGQLPPGNASWQNPDLIRARAAYRDAREVFELLRSDSEDLNNRLWRWSSRLREQLSAMERKLTRAQVAVVSDPQLMWQRALTQKDSYIRSADEQISELQAGLQAAQTRLLRRDGQVAALQDLLVQLSEQVNIFEGVVIRCEVLSADLVSKSGTGLA